MAGIVPAMVGLIESWIFVHMILKNSPMSRAKSHEIAERSTQQVLGMTTTLRSSLEEWKGVLWIVEHAERKDSQ